MPIPQHILDLMAERDARNAPPRNVQSAGEIALGQGAEDALKNAKRITALMEQAAAQNAALVTSMTPEIRALVAKQTGMSDQIVSSLNANNAANQPVLDKLRSDSLLAGDREAAAATAKADSDQSYQTAMDSARRTMISQGINPNDARYTDMLLTGEGQHAADSAGAVTNARRAALTTGLSALNNAANAGNASAANTTSALTAASAGLSNAGQGYSNLINASAAPMAGYGTALNAQSGLFRTQADLTAALAKTRADAEQNSFNNNLAATQVLSGMSNDPIRASKTAKLLGVNINFGEPQDGQVGYDPMAGHVSTGYGHYSI